MKKLSLAGIALLLKVVAASGQLTIPDSTSYKERRLHVDEVDFVSSYYRQDGNHSAVTGGAGTEYLTDFANAIDVRLSRRDHHRRLHSFNFEVGIDAYTSASSDKIDPATISSASAGDRRIYPSLAWTVKDEKTGWTAGAIGSYSTEYDYQSVGLGLSLAKSSADNNRELALRLQGYWDTWTVILPIELRSSQRKEEGTEPRASYSASLSYTQVINSRLQASVLVDAVWQQGLLATKYQRVYLSDHSVHSEMLPDSRIKFPIGLRLHYFAGSRFVLRSYYRYYTDDWGIRAHTVNLEAPVKLNPYLSVSPFYRYYTQTASDYFAPLREHTIADALYTSDYDLSAFQSHFAGLNIRYVPERGVLGIKQWKTAEVRYGHYIRSDGLASDVVSLNVELK